MIPDRVYPTPAGALAMHSFRVYFYDEVGKGFYRFVAATSYEAAIAVAMTEDRRAGGGYISYLRVVGA